MSEIFSRKSLFQTGICQQMPVNFSSLVNCCKYFISVQRQFDDMIRKRKEINNFSCHHPVSRGDGPQPYKESQTEFGEKKRVGEFHSWFVIISFSSARSDRLILKRTKNQRTGIEHNCTKQWMGNRGMGKCLPSWFWN